MFLVILAEITINAFRYCTGFSAYCENSQFHYSVKNAILKIYVDVTVVKPKLLSIKWKVTELVVLGNFHVCIVILVNPKSTLLSIEYHIVLHFCVSVWSELTAGLVTHYFPL